MSIFSKLPGNRYEVTISSLLQHFFMNSKVFRERFMENLSGKPGCNVYFTHDQMVSCEIEVFTESDDKKKGRLDILITVDNAVIGIESKFNAPIYDDQESKYLDYIKRRAKDAGKEAFFTIIAPNYRKREVEAKLQAASGKNICTILKDLNWEDVSDEIRLCLDRIKEEESPETYYLFKNFSQFLDESVGPIQKFPELFQFINKDPIYSPRVLSLRQKILDKIREGLLTDKISYRGSGAGTIHFGGSYETDNPDRWVWIGFTEKASKNPKHGNTQLVVDAVSKSHDLKEFNALRDKSSFDEVHDDNERHRTKWGEHRIRRFIITIQKDWDKSQVIAEAMKPVIAFLEGK